MCGFYRAYISDFSKISAPLCSLLKKHTKFVWTTEAQEALDMLKNRLTTAPVLGFPRFDLPFELHCDASGVAIGYVLSQQQEEDHKVISYGGRILSEAEKRITLQNRSGG